MKGKSAILIFLCFALTPLNNGFRVERNDDDSVRPLDEDEIFNEIHEDEIFNEIHEDEVFNEIHEDEVFNEIHEADEQITITSPVTEDFGVDGNLENGFPTELCDAEGSKMFLPITRNCSLFYDCTNKEGSACPHGMWFDPNYLDDTFCQFPEVICAADNTICSCAQDYPPPPPDPLIESSVSCLKDNRFHVMPSRVSCGRYFICHNDMKYRMECRQGLHYNDNTETCDYPEIVNCRMQDPECPSEGIKFLPDATRCEVFYFCVHGFKTKQICPFYHIWDIRSNSCRRQDEAVCHLEQ